MVQVGCDPFASNLHGKTPLDVAVEHGNLSVAQYLLSIGAVPNSPPFLTTGPQRANVDLLSSQAECTCDGRKGHELCVFRVELPKSKVGISGQNQLIRGY